MKQFSSSINRAIAKDASSSTQLFRKPAFEYYYLAGGSATNRTNTFAFSTNVSNRTIAQKVTQSQSTLTWRTVFFTHYTRIQRNFFGTEVQSEEMNTVTTTLHAGDWVAPIPQSVVQSIESHSAHPQLTESLVSLILYDPFLQDAVLANFVRGEEVSTGNREADAYLAGLRMEFIENHQEDALSVYETLPTYAPAIYRRGVLMQYQHVYDSVDIHTLMAQAAELGYHPAMSVSAFEHLQRGEIEQGMELLQLCADKFDSNTMNVLGQFYWRKLFNQEQDKEKAELFFKRSVDLGNAYAMQNLGEMYLKEGREEEAAKLFERGARQNHAACIQHLASLLMGGRGVPKDTSRAISLLKRGAKLDFSPSLYSLGWHYKHGVHIPQDTAKARELFERAISVDSEAFDAANELASMIKSSDPERAFQLWENGAKHGHYPSLLNAASCLAQGIGCTKDTQRALEICEKVNDAQSKYTASEIYKLEGNVEKSVQLLQEAAKENFVPALRALAECHQVGYGPLEESIPKTLEYMQRAVENGDLISRLNLARVYIFGAQQVEPDVELAKKYLEPLVQGEDPLPEADYLMGLAFIQQGDQTDSVTHMKRSADNGHSEAAYLMGQYYQHTDHDMVKSLLYYNKAGDANHRQALFVLGKLYEVGAPGMRPDLNLAVRYFEKLAALETRDAMAQFHVALLHGRAGDDTEAMKYFALSQELLGANPEHAREIYATLKDHTTDNEARLFLALMHEKGLGTDKDVEKAKEIYQELQENSTLAAARLRQLREETAQE